MSEVTKLIRPKQKKVSIGLKVDPTVLELVRSAAKIHKSTCTVIWEQGARRLAASLMKQEPEQLAGGGK